MNKNSINNICFVIMPFGGEFDGYYTKIYSKAIKKCNLKPVRVDDLFRASNIVKDIWDLTLKAKIILADLTGKNPNVFYELGLAHAIGKPAVILTKSLEDIPFDLRQIRAIIYDTKHAGWEKKLQSDIDKAIKETIDNPTSFFMNDIAKDDFGNFKDRFELSMVSNKLKNFGIGDLLAMHDDKENLDTSINIDSIRTDWLNFANKIAEKIPSLGRILDYSFPANFSGNELFVMFSEEHSSFKNLCDYKLRDITAVINEFYNQNDICIKFSTGEIKDEDRIIKIQKTFTKDDFIKEILTTDNMNDACELILKHYTDFDATDFDDIFDEIYKKRGNINISMFEEFLNSLSKLNLENDVKKEISSFLAHIFNDGINITNPRYIDKLEDREIMPYFEYNENKWYGRTGFTSTQTEHEESTELQF